MIYFAGTVIWAGPADAIEQAREHCRALGLMQSQAEIQTDDAQCRVVLKRDINLTNTEKR
jgi:hypothetical protein